MRSHVAEGARVVVADLAEGKARARASESTAVELGPDGIRVNAICPVIGETGSLDRFKGVPDTPDNRANFIATIPLGGVSRPSDVAAGRSDPAASEPPCRHRRQANGGWVGLRR